MVLTDWDRVEQMRFRFGVSKEQFRTMSPREFTNRKIAYLEEQFEEDLRTARLQTSLARLGGSKTARNEIFLGLSGTKYDPNYISEEEWDSMPNVLTSEEIEERFIDSS